MILVWFKTKTLHDIIAAEIFEKHRATVQQRQDPTSQLDPFSTVSPEVSQIPTFSSEVSPFPSGTPPTPSPQPPTQSCHATNHGLFNSYSVLIRIPYQGAAACDESWVPISSWQCEDMDGNIQLWFDAAIGVGIAYEINGALESRYPEVAGGFNCPPY